MGVQISDNHNDKIFTTSIDILVHVLISGYLELADNLRFKDNSHVLITRKR